MDYDIDASASPIHDSASVVLLRDSAAGLEVFLLERHARSNVLGGAHVFPGGKVDAQDHDTAMHALLDRAPAALRMALGEPSRDPIAAAALFVAALRELFEEAGVLLAHPPGTGRAESAWARVRAGEPFGAVACELGLVLEASALQPWSRWITPRLGSVSPKRFDTRFFLARAPHQQAGAHDEHEAISSLWIAPREALRRYWDGSMQLAPPQVLGLAHLARHASVASAIAEARSRPPVLVEPQPVLVEGERAMCYPGDPAHPCAERALPGPTRLHVRNGRFEPAGGFEGFFSA